MSQVVDYSFSHPSPQAIKDAGFIGAMRYLGWDFGVGPRCISKPEYDALRSIGVDVGLVWETTNNMVLRGAAGGHVDGAEAARQASSIGFPDGQFIHAAVDFDLQPSQYGIADAYFDAFNQHRHVISYGHYAYTEHRGDGWQCAAWSGFGSGTGGSIGGRRVSNRARLFQRVGYVLGNSCDVNDVLNVDWGQAGAAGGEIPPSPPVVIVDPHVEVGTVVEVQSHLTALALHNNDPSLDPHGVDGIWGPNTEAAVRSFQRQTNLPETGIVDEATMTAMRTLVYLISVENPPAPPTPEPPAPEPTPAPAPEPPAPPAPAPIDYSGDFDMATVEDLRSIMGLAPGGDATVLGTLGQWESDTRKFFHPVAVNAVGDNAIYLLVFHPDKGFIRYHVPGTEMMSMLVKTLGMSPIPTIQLTDPSDIKQLHAIPVVEQTFVKQ